MKTILSLGLALFVATGSVHAQILRSEALTGALLGGAAGAIVGHNSGDLGNNAWKGAAIGAGAGLILGEMAGNVRASDRSRPSPSYRPGYGDPYGYGQAPVYVSRPSIHVGVSYGSPGRRYGHHDRYRLGAHHGYLRDPFWNLGERRFSGWGHTSYPPAYNYHPGYGVGYPHVTYGDYGYGGASSRGLLLGALAGGIIGHNSGTLGHSAWRGAAWGAGAGWLLGTIADARQRAVVSEAPVILQTAPAAPVQAAAPAQPPQITIINNYYNTSPMSSANGLFGR